MDHSENAIRSVVPETDRSCRYCDGSIKCHQCRIKHSAGSKNDSDPNANIEKKYADPDGTRSKRPKAIPTSMRTISVSITSLRGFFSIVQSTAAAARPSAVAMMFGQAASG